MCVSVHISCSPPAAPLEPEYLFDNHTDGVYTFDLNGHFQSCNTDLENITGYTVVHLHDLHFNLFIEPDYQAKTQAAFTEITGYSQDEVIGRNCRFLQGENTAPETLENIRQELRHQTGANVELLNYRKDGTPFWNHLHIPGHSRSTAPVCRHRPGAGQAPGQKHLAMAQRSEIRAQQEDLTRRHCDILQGYLFARPMPLAEVEKLPDLLPTHLV